MFKKGKGKAASFNKHGINIEGAYGVSVFKDRLKRKQLSEHSIMNSGDAILNDDDAQIKGFASVLNQLKGDMTIEHPEYGVKLLVNPQVGAKAAYLMSCHGYLPAFLDAVHTYVRSSSTVLNVGAGFGVASVIAGLKDATKVVAIEPNSALHPVIAGNTALNKQSTQIEQGCLVPGLQQGDVDFYISEDVWSSSIYVDEVEVSVKSMKVPVLSLTKLVQKHSVDTLILDIKGAELGLFDDADISNVHTVIISFDYELLGGKGVSKVMSALFAQGLTLVDMMHTTAIFCKKERK